MATKVYIVYVPFFVYIYVCMYVYAENVIFFHRFNFLSFYGFCNVAATMCCSGYEILYSFLLGFGFFTVWISGAFWALILVYIVVNDFKISDLEIFCDVGFY